MRKTKLVEIEFEVEILNWYEEMQLKLWHVEKGKDANRVKGTLKLSRGGSSESLNLKGWGYMEMLLVENS